MLIIYHLNERFLWNLKSNPKIVLNKSKAIILLLIITLGTASTVTVIIVTL